MRPWFLLVLLVACAEPRRPPTQPPADPDSVNGCRPRPGTLGSVYYTCTSYALVDSVGEGTLRSIEAELVTAAHGKGFTSTSRAVAVDGVGITLLIQYREPRGGHAFDMLATATLPEGTRLVQCHMRWFDNASSQPTREQTCEDAIRTLLARPAPARVEVSAECRTAAARLPTLPGRPDDAEDLRRVMRSFAESCTDKVAACALAARSYVEATLCWSK